MLSAPVAFLSHQLASLGHSITVSVVGAGGGDEITGYSKAVVEQEDHQNEIH